MPHTASDITGLVADLMRLHNGNSPAQRYKIRSVINGGAEGVRALLGDRAAATYGDDLPAPNIIASGLDRLAQKLGRAPLLKVDAPAERDTDRARRAAEKRRRIVQAYDDTDRLDMQLPQVARWLPGYGYAVWVVCHRVDQQGHPYPAAQLRDPYDTYLGRWGPTQEPAEIAIRRSVTASAVARSWPEVAERLTRRRSTATRVVTGEGRWEGGSGDIEVVEYIDKTGTYVWVPELGDVVDYIVNPLGDTAPFVVAKRFSFDQLQGQYDQLIGMMSMLAKYNILSLIAGEDSTFTETNIIGEIESGQYRRGRHAINFFSPGTQIERTNSRIPFEMFTQIDRLERQLRIGGNYPMQDDGQSPISFVTGRGIEQLSDAATSNVREYQTSIRSALERLDAMRLCWDEKLYPDQTKPLVGYIDGGTYSETYTPARHIAGNYRTRRVYGVMAGWDEPQKIVTGLQLLQGEIIDTRTMQENLDGLSDLGVIEERIRGEKSERVLFELLAATAQSPDPAERAKAAMALVEMRKDPKATDRILDKFFTAQEPQMSPEEEQMINNGGMPPTEPGVGGGLPVPATPPDVQTILSQLQQSGQVQGGAQTVGMMPVGAGGR